MATKHPIKIGGVFGRWTVIGTAQKRKIPCRCSCGTEKNVNTSNLRSGKTVSCGCYQRQIATDVNLKHGHGGRDSKSKTPRSPTYSSWASMVKRCTNPKDKAYDRYGGKGIKVCDRWLVFENFLEDMGPRPDGCTIDRYPDQTGNYEPGNCRWATSQEQGYNQTTNRLITYKGRTQCLAAWAKETGIRRVTLAARLNAGKSVEEAFSPVRPQRGKDRLA